MKTVATAHDNTITGIPTFIHSKVVNGYGLLSLIATTITLALDPMGVAFPPKPAPIANAQKRGAAERVPPLASVISTITGIIAAVNGMLSTTALATAETQMIATAKTTGSEPKFSKIHFAK